MARLPINHEVYISLSFLFTSLLYLDISSMPLNLFMIFITFNYISGVTKRETITIRYNSFSGILKAKVLKSRTKNGDELNNQLIQNFVILNANIKETDILLSEAYKNSKGLEFVPAKIATLVTTNIFSAMT